MPFTRTKIRWMLTCCLAAHASLSSSDLACCQVDRVRLDITNTSTSLFAAQEWQQALSALSFRGLRIANGSSLPQPTVERRSDGTFQVTGVITSSDQLLLPGLRVNIHQLDEINRWAEGLSASERQPTTPAATQAFGMSAEQLVNVHRKLAVALDTATRGKSARDVVRDIRRAVGIPIQVHATAARGIQQRYEISDELQGVSVGTALAATLRPLGLVMVPQWRSNQLELVIFDSRAAREFWPIGWPTQKKKEALIPTFFDFLPIEIEDVAANQALDAIQQRLNVPFLYDQNGMARRDIALAAIPVSVSSSRTFYKRALDRMLYQCRLTSEIRVDEAERPLVWIYPSGRKAPVGGTR